MGTGIARLISGARFRSLSNKEKCHIPAGKEMSLVIVTKVYPNMVMF